MTSTSPRATVVVPTYNRTDELRATLTSLAAQDLPSDDFEVVVSDDGSSDDTAAVVRSFESRLNLRYTFQEDRGARAATARNAGARLASSPVLIFTDSGTLAGPGFVRGHLAEHEAGAEAGPVAVIGYTYGYRPFDPTPGLLDAVEQLEPAQVREQYGDHPSFQDCRHPEYAAVDFDVEALPLPWIMGWAVNLSVLTAEFWRVGGFDDAFQGWGVEDLDLSLRLHKGGVRFVVGRDAWAIETPHERDPAGNAESVTRNALQLLGKFPGPQTEVNWSWFSTGSWLVEANSAPLHAQFRTVLDWQAEVRDVQVENEIAAAVGDLPRGSSVAVLGCGAAVPASLPEGSELLDFDADVLASLPADLPHRTHHALGLRTVLPDHAVDVVVVTSRLSGVWQQYGDLISAEARRVGRSVRVTGDVVARP